MSGGVPQLPLYAFKAWIGTNLLFTFTVMHTVIVRHGPVLTDVFRMSSSHNGAAPYSRYRCFL
jgi:hypothetical protein